MSKPKNQHWVPRFYLKEFSTLETRDKEEFQVWIFSKKDGDPAKPNIKGVAAKRYLYSPQDESGNRCWKTEEKLASLESTISRFWSDFANDSIDLNHIPYRKGISLFLATTFLRHPKRLQEYNNKQTELIRFFNTFPKDKDGRPLVSHIETKNGTFEIDTSDWDKYSNPTEYDLQMFFVDTIEKSAIQLAEAFMKKRWSVLFSDSEQFVTSDNPLVIYDKNDQIKNNGINVKGTKIMFPISPKRVLFIDDLYNEPHSQYYQLRDNTTAAAINRRTWHNAHQLMLSPRDIDEVLTEIYRL